jgi:hypothetical protein
LFNNNAEVIYELGRRPVLNCPEGKNKNTGQLLPHPYLKQGA